MSHLSHLSPISAGFSDPVHDAQAAFRATLDALSRPGRRVEIGQTVKGLTIGSAMAHVLLALTDSDTPVWWQQDDSGVADWLRFHTGASQAATPADAAFAAVLNPAELPSLASFAVGSAEAPEHSATLLLEVPSLDAGPAVEWRGPGILGMHAVQIAGLPDDFWAQWQANVALFPQGLDIILPAQMRRWACRAPPACGA